MRHDGRHLRRRASLSVRILEEQVCGGLVNYTNSVENVPSYPSIHGEDLMAKCREHVDALGVTVEEVTGVTGVDFTGDMKTVTTDTGDVYEAPAVIVATGRRPRPLPVKTDFPNVHYCSVCDGAAYRGKDVLVLGGGNSGFDESLYLAALGVRSIHIVEVFPTCIADAATQEQARALGSITVSVSTEIARVDSLASGRGLVRLRDRVTGEERDEEVDGIFCFIGQVPNTRPFEGVLPLDHGYIATNADMETSLPGVFAAGDVTVKKYRQITTAMGDGTVAALQAASYLRARRAAAARP